MPFMSLASGDRRPQCLKTMGRFIASPEGKLSGYVTAPWTRDGSVRVQVASVAPEVSGRITEVRVVDNQFVHQGDVLYVIDPFDFQVALDTGKAQLRQKAADLQVK